MFLKQKSPKRYLVTGGCGFIGSHLTDALIDKGHSVVILDNLSSGKKENAHPKASLIVGDTTSSQTIEHALKEVDGCFHLAAIASVEQSTNQWAKSHKTNITSTINIFEAISKLEKKIPVVYTSSAAVYGDCPAIPITEYTTPIPLTAYGADKLACDLHARIAWNVHKIPNIGLRPFNIYGPRQESNSPYSGVISIFFNRILYGIPITVFGDGEQIRDFVYVSDAVKAFMTAMDKLGDTSNFKGHDIINICTGNATSINELSEVIEKISGRKMRRSHEQPRKGDIRTSIGDPSRLSSRLNLNLDIPLEKGLQLMLKDINIENNSKHSADSLAVVK